MQETARKSAGRSITMKDVARAAGVSSATVSYVLNDLNKVSAEVDAHVRRVAQELGYSRNTLATALKTGRRSVIGFVVPSLLSPVFPEIMRAVQQRAQDYGLATFVVESCLGGESEAAAILWNHGVDGAIAVLEARPQMTQAPLFPIVVLDRTVEGLDSVMCDHFQGGLLMAETIGALGHRRIGILSGNPEMQSSQQRRAGLLAGLLAGLGAGLDGKIEVIWECIVPLETELPPEAVARLAQNEVSLIACVNDVVGYAALSTLKRLDIAVPSQVSVLGFDDMLLAASPLVDLSTIHQSLAEMGRQAVDLLVRRIETPQAPIETRVLPVRPQLRGSTQAVRPSA